MTHLIYDERLLTVTDPPKELEQAEEFKFVEKIMEVGARGSRITKRKTQSLWRVLQEENPRVIKFHQGMWRDVSMWLHRNGFLHTFDDTRQPIIPLDGGVVPRYENMFGFRFSQESLLTQALKQERSGLIGAPTRYGKTTLIINTLRAYPGVCTVVVLPGRDLIRQMRDDIKAAFPDREVKLLGGGSSVKYMSNDVTVCSMDSMHKLDPGRVRLVLVDEPHALPTSGRMPDFVALDRARKIGFGATLHGRYDNRDVLIKALIGPVLASISFKEAVAEGAICDITVFMLPAPMSVTNHRCQMGTVLKNNLWESRFRADQVRYISEKILPPDWQTLYFIGEENSARFYQPYLEGSEIAMAKLMDSSEREDRMARMKDNSLKRCLSSNIYAQGVTFHDVRAIFNLVGGGPYTSTIQKPGRLAEIRPGKRCGVMFDWMFSIPEEHWGGNLGGAYWGPVEHSKARLEAYREIGYNVQMVQDLRELPDMFQQFCL